MIQRALIYVKKQSGQTRTEPELTRDLQRVAEDRGDVVKAIYADDDALTGRGRNAGWKALIASLGDVDQIVLATVGDIPGRTVTDLLRTLGMFQDRGVDLYFTADNIDTGTGSAFTVLSIIEAYRRARLSRSIKQGQSRARANGKKLGRPEIPKHIQRRIQIALDNGGGIRRTARAFNVSPASVLNIMRRPAQANVEAEVLAA